MTSECVIVASANDYAYNAIECDDKYIVEMRVGRALKQTERWRRRPNLRPTRGNVRYHKGANVGALSIRSGSLPLITRHNFRRQPQLFHAVVFTPQIVYPHYSVVI